MSVQDMDLIQPDSISKFRKDGEFSELHATEDKAVFFQLKAQMLEQGRTNTPMVKSDNMWVVLKVYASGGENGLHTHTHEDHIFVVMQGAARFYGPNGEETDVQTHGGVMLPAGCYYWFECISEEPLVLMRVGCKAPGREDQPDRTNIRGEPMTGDDPANKQEETIYKKDSYFV